MNLDFAFGNFGVLPNFKRLIDDGRL